MNHNEYATPLSRIGCVCVCVCSKYYIACVYMPHSLYLENIMIISPLLLHYKMCYNIYIYIYIIGFELVVFVA